MTVSSVVESFSHTSHRIIRFSEADVLSFPAHESCPTCGNENFARTLVELGAADWKERLRLVECVSCETVYYQNPPDSDFVARYYRDTWKQGDGESLEHVGKTRRKRSKTTMVKILADYGMTDPGTKILDIGCGLGHLLNGLHDAGYKELWGTEMSPYRVTVARQRFGERIFSGGYEGVPDGMRFDVIYANHVFEHIRHSGQAFAWMKEHLTDRGVIILVVPNAWYEPVISQVMFLPHLHSFASRSFSVLARTQGMTAKFWRNGVRHDLACVFTQPASQHPAVPNAFDEIAQLEGAGGTQRERITAPWISKGQENQTLAITKTYLSGDEKIRASGYSALFGLDRLRAKTITVLGKFLSMAGCKSIGRKIGRHGAHISILTRSFGGQPVIICDRGNSGLFAIK